jgi:DNA polymerase-3 subunit gamma/tau
MAYQVIARKWRPQTFSEVIFQDHVSRTIRNSIKYGRISHAYLFSGPRGVGKTTMARIVARALNCKEGPTPDPCGKCENCLEIKQGISFDVIEIDGASNNGVENVREIRENVNFAPAKSRYKVYIIDEVHMVTTQAFNALLKTLEEPPPHVVFIFATTEIHKIPDTILSRCQKYFFKKIPAEVVVNHLKEIVKKEGYKIAPGALYPLARVADGSMRDAQSLLDQVISFSGSHEGSSIEISEEDALSILGIVPFESYIRIMGFIAETDVNGVIKEVDRIVAQGIDLSRYISGLVDIIRSVRFINNGIDIKGILTLSEDEVDGLKKISSSFNDEILSRFFSIISDLSAEIRFTSGERIYLEMALLDMISVVKSPSVAEIIKKLESNDSGQKYESLNKTVEKKKITEDKASSLTEKKEFSGNIDSIWSDFIKDLGEQKNHLYYILRPVIPGFESGKLTLNYPYGIDIAEYARTLDRKVLDFIEKDMSRRCGENIKCVFDQLKRPEIQPAKEPVNTSVPEEDYADEAPLPDAEMISQPEKGDFEVENTSIALIKNAFYGEIIKKGE